MTGPELMQFMGDALMVVLAGSLIIGLALGMVAFVAFWVREMWRSFW